MPSVADLHSEFLRHTHLFVASFREEFQRRALSDVARDLLTYNQMNILKLLSVTGDQQIADVASFLGVTLAGASKAINWLEAAGLVSRREDPNDARASQISLTSEGKTLAAAYDRRCREMLKPVLNGISAEEIARWIELMKSFTTHIYDQTGTGTRSCLRCGAYESPGCVLQGKNTVCDYQRRRRSHRRRSRSS